MTGGPANPTTAGISQSSGHHDKSFMCNLYSLRGKPKDWAAHYGATRYDPFLDYDYTSCFPDFLAPVIRNSEGEREVAMMRWGFPQPPAVPGPPVPVTNVRNTASSHWREWLKPENRCLVPATSFAEYARAPDPVTKKKDVIWFALNDNRPPFAFAGMAVMARHQRHEEESDRRRPPALFHSHDRGQRGGKADSPEGHAGRPGR